MLGFGTTGSAGCCTRHDRKRHRCGVLIPIDNGLTPVPGLPVTSALYRNNCCCPQQAGLLNQQRGLLNNGRVW
jgi:hypothetical protein